MGVGPGNPPLRPALIRTPDQRLRVFVSSTLGELAEERAAAREAIEGLRLAPVMFELGARPHPPRDLYRAYLEQSHIFIGIYWQRYGWVAPGESVSGLEDEYRLSGARPRLIYLKTPAEPERRLAELLDRVRADRAASYRRFTTAEELRGLIQDDLAVLLAERFEQVVDRRGDRLPGWAHTNLPVPRSPLVGREAELAATCDLLRQADVGLVTLTGPGGCGKSRLALEIGLQLLGQFEDGVFLVALESILDPALVIPAIADTLNLRASPERPALDQLADQLREARLLLLLDNFEQVVAAGPRISMLLERCPRLVILATSRTPLRLRGERRRAVPPLAVPLAACTDLESLSQYAAVTLFVERARAVQPDFAVTTENAPVVAEICHRLDGLPLAIELAAARLRLLAPTDLLSRLSRRFNVLRGGTRDLPERQQALRRTIDWSHDLLDEDARKAFRRLSVFAGGATLEAAEAVSAGGGGDLDADVLDVISSLIDDSMLTSSIGELGDLRIGMLDTIREYAAEKLHESGELDRVRRSHAAWYVALAERAEPHLVTADEAAWATRLQAEQANTRIALDWSAAHDAELGLRIAAAMWRFWEFHGSIAEGHDWLERLLALPGEPGPVRGKALEAASRFAASVGAYDTAHRHISAAMAIFRRTRDRAGIARVNHEMGALALFEGKLPEARRRLEAALTMRRALGDAWGLANTLSNLGLVAACEGDLERGEALLREGLIMYEDLDDRFSVAGALGNLAEVARLRGRLDDARSDTLASLRLAQQMGDKDRVAGSFDSLAKLANAGGDHARAVRLFGLASALREVAGTTPPVPEREELERELSVARAALDPASFEREWRAGRLLTVDEALEPWMTP